MKMHTHVCLLTLLAIFTSLSKSHAEYYEFGVWGSPRSVVYTDLKDAVLKSNVKPRENFAEVELLSRYEKVLFKKVPDGWSHPLNDSILRQIYVNEEGIRVSISIRREASDIRKTLSSLIDSNFNSIVLFDHLFLNKTSSIPRVVQCAPSKGPSLFIEYRYYQIEDSIISIRLAISPDSNEQKLDDIVSKLNVYYSEYESVCREVETLITQED